MKNLIVVDIDSDRERKVKFSKLPDVQLPSSSEEAHQMIINDIATLAHGINELISIATQDNPQEREKYISAVIKTLTETTTTPTQENE